MCHGLNITERKAVSAQTLHYFLCRINATVVVKGLMSFKRYLTNVLIGSCAHIRDEEWHFVIKVDF